MSVIEIFKSIVEEVASSQEFIMDHYKSKVDRKKQKFPLTKTILLHNKELVEGEFKSSTDHLLSWLHTELGLDYMDMVLGQKSEIQGIVGECWRDLVNERYSSFKGWESYASPIRGMLILTNGNIAIMTKISYFTWEKSLLDNYVDVIKQLRSNGYNVFFVVPLDITAHAQMILESAGAKVIKGVDTKGFLDQEWKISIR